LQIIEQLMVTAQLALDQLSVGAGKRRAHARRRRTQLGQRAQQGNTSQE
jgi:hypothetical protein